MGIKAHDRISSPPVLSAYISGKLQMDSIILQTISCAQVSKNDFYLCVCPDHALSV